MALELAKAWVRVRGDSSMLQGDLNRTRSMVTNSIREMAAGVSVGVAAMTGAFAAFTGGFIRSGLAQAGMFEQTKVGMETMLGSVEETRKTLKELTDFAVKTPFEMPSILQVATGLIMFGERGEELKETMNILADASGGTAAKFAILGRVLNEIRGVGKLMTMDFRQLSTRGIISLTDIAKFYKVSTAEAQKMLSTGKIVFKDFKAILKGLTEEGGRFFQSSIKQSRTLIGLQSTLSDAWNITLRKIAMGLLPAMKAGLDLFIGWANAFEAWVSKAGPVVGQSVAMANGFAMVAAALTAGRMAARLFGTTLTHVFIGSGIGIVIIAIGAAVGFLVGQLNLGQGMQQTWVKSADNLKLAWLHLKEVFVSVWNSMSIALGGFGIDLKTLRADTRDFIRDVSITVSEFVLEFAKWMRVIAENWETVWEAFPRVAVAGMKLALFGFLEIMRQIWNASSKGIRLLISLLVTLITIWITYRVVVTAATIAQATFLAVSGPKGWAMLAGGIIAAAIATGFFIKGMKNAKKEVKEAMDEMNKALAPLNKLKADFDFGFDEDRIKRLKLGMEGVKNAARGAGLGAAGMLLGLEEGGGKKKGEEFAKAVGKEMSKPGFIGFAALGANLQEKLLAKKDGDKQHQAKMEGFAAQGNAMQERIALAVEKKPPGIVK